MGIPPGGSVLGGADRCAFFRASGNFQSFDSLRQARHRSLRSGGAECTSHTGTAHGRRQCGHGCRGLFESRTVRHLRRRSNVCPLRGHVSGPRFGTGDVRVLSQMDQGRRLPLGSYPGAARGGHGCLRGSLGNSYRIQDGRAQRRRRRALPELVGPQSSNGRQPGRRDCALSYEHRDRYSRRVTDHRDTDAHSPPSRRPPH